MTIELMDDTEVATILRCSDQKVKRLRLSGHLAYLPGRPPLIEASALVDYIASAIRPVKPRKPEKSTELMSTSQQKEIAARVIAARMKQSRRQGG